MKANTLKTQILKTLRNSSDYISGQELCESLRVSRTAVWKVIHQLEEEGYSIEAVQNKGYRLINIPDLLTAAELESRRKTSWVGSNIFYKPQVNSTNTLAKSLAEEGAEHGSLVLADHQTAGKGRRGKTWESPSGTGIWMSLILKPEMNPRNASMITLVMAVCVCKAIEEVTNLKPMIKWPNDIVAGGKKVCGILTEMSAEMTYVNHIVIGVGINVNTKGFPDDISQIATSLLIEEGKSVNRVNLVEKIMESFEVCYDLFMKHEDLTELLEEYETRLINKGRQVRILQPSGELIGQSLGINKLGELLVKKTDGEVISVYAGEVSVRGIYGYV